MDQTTTYYIRIGTRRAKTPAEDLYDQPSRTCGDDGAIIVHAGDHTPPCTCGRGTLLWAEAGYVSWHRICSHCGSHWELHPITWGPARPSRGVRPSADAPHHADDCDVYWDEEDERGRPIRHPCTCGAQPAIDRARSEREALVARSGGLVRWVDGRGEVPLDPDERVSEEEGAPTWGAFVALLTPEHWVDAEREAERMAGMVVVPCCWARRARFYAR